MSTLRTIGKRAFFALLLLACTSAWAGEWSLKDGNGMRYSLSSLQGKWVLVNFWAPWCPICIQEMPELESLQQEHKDLQVLGVAVMYRSKQQVADAVKKHALSYPIILGNEDTAGDFGGMNGMPTSFLYSPGGKLVKRIEGPLTKAGIEQAMAKK